MFSKVQKTSQVKNILIINMSNIGDVLLSAPAMDIILRDFPLAKCSVVVGERAASVFEGNARFEHIYIFDKHAKFFEQVQFILQLRKAHFDLVVDFRNTLIGYFLFPKWATPLAGKVDKEVHLKERHLNRLRTVYDFDLEPNVKNTILPSKNDEALVDGLLASFLKRDEPFVAIAPIAADKTKTWTPQGFMDVCNAIGKTYGYKIVLLGSQKDNVILENIKSNVNSPVLNIAGKTNLLQAAALIRRAAMVIVHDSGPMHIASYLDKPTVALFGPTEPKRSRPWGQYYAVVHENQQCARCLNQSADSAHTCMSAIKPEHVMKAFAQVKDQMK